MVVLGARRPLCHRSASECGDHSGNMEEATRKGEGLGHSKRSLYLSTVKIEGRHLVDQSNCQERPYHHGALRLAILDAAERRLMSDGPESVSIRACARDAGVSSAAPLHHFGSLKGLLSALAARGFERLVARLDADLASGREVTREAALVGAYVAFAVHSPQMFDLMWRDDILDMQSESLLEARRNALERLRSASDAPADSGQARRRAIRNWSLAHGLATLLLHGRILKALGDPDNGLATAEDFVALAYEAEFSRTTE